MLTPTRALRTAAGRGDLLPALPELEAMYRWGFQPRRGQMLMIAGQTGAAKTFFALWLVAGMGLRTKYFSADSDAHTMISRLIAYQTGLTTDQVADQLKTEPEAFASVLEGCPIEFCFDSNPSIDDVNSELDAWVEIWDGYPEVIVIDNLIDLDAGDESYQARVFAMQELHRLRSTGAAVIVLHHTRSNPAGKNNWSASQPQPRWEIDNKLDRKPDRILTVAHDEFAGQFGLSPVKNRDGPQSPGAEIVFRLGADLSRCNFYGG